MKLICDGHDLSEAVSKVFKAASTRSTSAILEGIKLKAADGTLVLTATDMELTIEKTIVADVKINGETVVPGKFFSEFVKKLVKEQIELMLDDKNRLTIRYMDSVGVMQCLPAAEFPALRGVEGSQTFTIISSEFKDLINKTAFSVCQDDSRPMLKGVLLEVDSTALSAVALDGYRLAKCAKPIESTSALMSAIVPARCITEIARLLPDNTDKINVYIQKNYLLCDLGHTQVMSRLIDGDFINYKQIIPSIFESVVTLPSGAFEAGLERAILLSRIEKNNLVRFEVKGDTMLLTSSGDIGNVEEKISVKLNGSDITIAFNARYFTELLKYIGSDNITIKFTNSVSPCIVTPSGTADEVMYLVLPVRMAG